MANNNKNIRIEITKRFFEIVDELSLETISVIKNPLDFCKKIKLGTPAFYMAKKGERHIPIEAINRFAKKFPIINKDYILNGVAPKYHDPLPAPVEKILSPMTRIRKRFNMSQEEMCAMLGLTQAQVSHYETGVANIPDKIKIRLHARLKISYKFLIENDGAMIEGEAPLAPEQITPIKTLRSEAFSDRINHIDHKKYAHV